MVLISHRDNLNGADPIMKNLLEYIFEALNIHGIKNINVPL